MNTALATVEFSTRRDIQQQGTRHVQAASSRRNDGRGWRAIIENKTSRPNQAGWCCQSTALHRHQICPQMSSFLSLVASGLRMRASSHHERVRLLVLEICPLPEVVQDSRLVEVVQSGHVGLDLGVVRMGLTEPLICRARQDPPSISVAPASFPSRTHRRGTSTRRCDATEGGMYHERDRSQRMYIVYVCQ